MVEGEWVGNRDGATHRYRWVVRSFYEPTEGSEEKEVRRGSSQTGVQKGIGEGWTESDEVGTVVELR